MIENITTTEGSNHSLITNPADMDDVDSDRVFVNIEIIRHIYYIIAGIGILGNGFVIVVFTFSRRLRHFSSHLTDVYLLNQSILDGIASVLLLFSTMFENRDQTPLYGFSGELFCRLWLSKVFPWGFFFCSTYNLVVVNVERYFGILHPLWHKLHFTKRTVMLTVVFIWLSGYPLNVGFTVSTTHLDENGNCIYLDYGSSEFQMAVGITVAVVHFFIPMIIHTFCLIRIVLFLHSRADKLGQKGSDRASNSNVTSSTNQFAQQAIKARNKVFKVLLMMTVCFFLCWVWNSVYFLLFNLGVSVPLQGVFYHFTVIAVYVNCFTNPFVYMFRYKRFRVEAMKLFGCCYKRDDDATTVCGDSVEMDVKSSFTAISTINL